MTEQRRIGRYQILEEIASGGQGTVYQAYDPEGGQIIALKVLHPTLAGDRRYTERFRREASLAASIDHPNVVKIFEVGQDGDTHFMALEFLPQSLAGIIQRVGQPLIEGAVQYGVQIADGLAAAHALGIVHRDVKPQNVLIGQDGTAKVTDFGIARGEAFNTMTAMGVVMGIPHYMSPEQAQGERADTRSDVYSLGCMLYHMLAGEVPFKGETPVAVIRQQIDEQPRRLRELRRDLPRRLEAVVERSMAKEPGRRYQSTAKMAQALRAAEPDLADLASPPRREPTQPPRPAAPRRRRWALAGGTLAALVLVLAIGISALGGPDWVNGIIEAKVAAIGVPTTSPATGRIAFVSFRDGNREIYVMNSDGSDRNRVTNKNATDSHPAWSPDGAKIAFMSDRDGNFEIYVMNADGTGQTRITNNDARDASPAWSPDGARIAFTSDRDGNPEIYVMNADGSRQTRLTNNTDPDLSPAWSPTASAAETLLPAPSEAIALPVASPVSGRIAFSSNRDGNFKIYVMSADGSGQIRLTNIAASDGDPAWSPDNAKIAFSSNRDGNREIYVMNADGTGQTRLTKNLAFDVVPAWSPE